MEIQGVGQVNYTELHLHSHYSLLDGLNTPEEYLKRGAELGMTHMALTDHGNLSGHREFQRAAKEVGITPILGCEMYISSTGRFDRRAVAKREDDTQAYNHLIVLAQNEEGLTNLNRLSEIAWTEGFYSKPRIDMEVLEEHNSGLIVLTGCLNGLISKALEKGDLEEAMRYGSEFKRIFGDRVFMEIQGHNPREINEGLLHVGDKFGIKPVVTSDCHYARKEDLWIEQALLIISANPKPSKDFDFSKAQKMDMLERFNYAYPDRRMNFEDFDLFLHSAEDHMTSGHWPADSTWDMSRVEEAINNTMVVANMIGEYPYHEALDLLPRPQGEVKGETPEQARERAAEMLTDMAWKGLKERGLFGKEEYRARLQEELDIICPRFPEYFIIEADFVQWAIENGIRVGPGRGSGAGSLLLYALRVTNVDPIKYGLLFFRFLNPERNDYPDVDTDFEIHRRAEVKAYVKRKYKNIASIATFGTFQGKQSIRDASRAFMVPLGDVNKALKGADWPSNMDFFEMWEKTDKGRDFAKKYPEVITLAKYLYGRIKSQGMHAGGVVFSNEDISKYAPMQSAKDTQDDAGERIPLVALDMDEAAKVGFIKYDMLGLKALTIISDALLSIKERHGIDIDLDNLPLDDPKVYASLSEGWTRGVFQCEATPYTNLIIKMGGVKDFNDLVASNALVRPGAANSSAGAAYIARNKGEEPVKYHHPIMEPFTKETYGVVIYQEQVMLTMTELAGMSMGTADKVRKIIGKKRDKVEFEQYKAEFIEGASKHVSRDVAEGLWHDFEAHAGYSFNKSHAVAYSMISYYTAWLKENYPLEFMYAVLKNENDKDSRLDYLIETKRMGIRVKLPHVNLSGLDFEIQNVNGEDVIRFGLSDIKFISGKIGQRLIDARPFANYNELKELVMTKGSGLSTRVLGSLNAVGAAAFTDHPLTGQERDNFFEYLSIPAFQTADLPPKMKAQFRTLDEFSETETFVTMAMVRGIKTGNSNGRDWARVEIVDETGSAGVFTNGNSAIETGQMYVFLIAKNSIARYISVEDLSKDLGGEFQEFLERQRLWDTPEGMFKVVSFNGRVTAAGKRMADITFADEHKNMYTALVWPSQYAQAHTKCKEGNVVDVVLKELDDGGLAVDYFL
jgi:DNA polymerase-3 subunit alpha